MGFLACGIIPMPAFDEYNKALDQRIESFPESRELYEPLYNQTKKIENAKTLIVCTQSYNNYRVPESLNGLIGKMYLFDSRLSYSEEYRARQEFESFLKTLGIEFLQGSVPARWAAAKAGVGKFGRNNFIYDPVHGSYLTILTWVTDTELEYDEPVEAGLTGTTQADTTLAEGCSENCRKCINTCPTGALNDSLSMNRGKCIAELSFFAKELPDEETQTKMGRWIYGCDACQDCCPMNSAEDRGVEAGASARAKKDFPLLGDYEKFLKPEFIINMDQVTYENIINPRFWYMGKDNLWLWKANALRNMANSGSYHHGD